MFLSSKPIAPLSSGLLARKGQAKPAMRPQAYAMLPSVTPNDDLGWNDMGGDVAECAPELPRVLLDRAALTGGAGYDVPVEASPIATGESARSAPCGLAPCAPRAVDVVVAEATLPVPRAAARGKAAFTLRLDTHRHLRLRLASAVSHRSSQALLTDALDTLLNTLPEVEELARRCLPPAQPGDPQ